MIILPKNDLVKQKILSQIAKKFSQDKQYKESEVNDIIKSFDVEDHVLFRRELINFGYLQRDPYKGNIGYSKQNFLKKRLLLLEKDKRDSKKINNTASLLSWFI